MILFKTVQKKLLFTLLILTLLLPSLLSTSAHAATGVKIDWTQWQKENALVGASLFVYAYIVSNNPLDNISTATVSFEDRTYPMETLPNVPSLKNRYTAIVSFNGLSPGLKKLTIKVTTRSGLIEESSRSFYYDTVPAIFEFDTLAQMASEESRVANVKMVRKGTGHGVVDVGYFARGKSATINVDFIPGPTYITFNDGEMSKILQITLIDDKLPERLEAFELEVIPLNGTSHHVEAGEINKTTVVIKDADR
ncbi:Calx-beta domain-containing protein [Paenibacillus sp. SYP-B3998]|nr:Calx-beta domain-containing protein [Paenibacillus sp. SYP-B3998]